MYDNSFSSQRLKEVEGDPHVYVIDGKIWEVKAGNYSDEKFPVFTEHKFLLCGRWRSAFGVYH